MQRDIGTRAVVEEAADADVVPSGAQNQLQSLTVEFDNVSDPDATIIKASAAIRVLRCFQSESPELQP